MSPSSLFNNFLSSLQALFFSSSPWGDGQREAAASLSDERSDSQWTFPCKQRTSNGTDCSSGSGNPGALMAHTAVLQVQTLN